MPEKQDFRSVPQEEGLSVGAREAGFFGWWIWAHTIGCVPQIPDSLLDGELVVTGGCWVPFVKFAEFVPASWGEVVEGLFGPVLSVWVVEPSDEVEDAASFLGAAHDLVDVVGFS